jgi:hypothetical protein
MTDSQDAIEGSAPRAALAEPAPAAGRGGLAGLSLAVLGAGFAWFAYIDAPITDGAMLLFTAAVAAGFLSVCAAIIGGGGALAGRTAFSVRAGRAAVLLFLVALALMLAAATLTLNLKGTGADDAETQTAATVPA